MYFLTEAKANVDNSNRGPILHAFSAETAVSDPTARKPG